MARASVSEPPSRQILIGHQAEFDLFEPHVAQRRSSTLPGRDDAIHALPECPSEARGLGDEVNWKPIFVLIDDGDDRTEQIDDFASPLSRAFDVCDLVVRGVVRLDMSPGQLGVAAKFLDEAEHPFYPLIESDRRWWAIATAVSEGAFEICCEAISRHLEREQSG